MTTLFIGSDHAGFETKQYIIETLTNQKLNIFDIGTFDNKSCHYPLIAKKVCIEVLKCKNSYGILLCGTGIGMSIAANRIKNIRCGLVYCQESSKMAKKHNNCNVISLGARFFKQNEILNMIEAFLNATFEEKARHQERINMLET